MHKFWTLLSREVRSYFYSPIAYVVMIFFLIISGIDFYFQVSFMNQRQVQYTIQEAFFNSIFFWFAFVLIFPLITMRLFAEEFKLGTIEPLTTAPVRDWQVVLSKFFGALVSYVILWIPTLLYCWIFPRIANQPAAHAAGAYVGSSLMLLLLGVFYLPIGCRPSVLTRHQIVAAIISVCAIPAPVVLGPGAYAALRSRQTSCEPGPLIVSNGVTAQLSSPNQQTSHESRRYYRWNRTMEDRR